MLQMRSASWLSRAENGVVRLGTKKILPLGLNFDHKIGGFYELTPFINKLEEIFASPEVIFSW